MAAEGDAHTLQATELVHEAYLKLAPALGERGFKNHYDFYGAAGEAMRRILVDHARRRQAAKRGGGMKALPIGCVADLADLADTADPTAMLALNEAFEHLGAENPELGEVVRLRFFAGLSVEETARALGLSEPTVKRRWRFARALLFEALEGKVSTA
jgi:RNA polymerase sigma factor (TIGR02999 family)